MVANKILSTPQPNQQSAENRELESDGKLHPSNEPAILFHILINFEDWFSPQDLVTHFGQLDAQQFEIFCLKYSHPFFATYSESNGTNYRFRRTIDVTFRS